MIAGVFAAEIGCPLLTSGCGSRRNSGTGRSRPGPTGFYGSGWPSLPRPRPSPWRAFIRPGSPTAFFWIHAAWLGSVILIIFASLLRLLGRTDSSPARLKGRRAFAGLFWRDIGLRPIQPGLLFSVLGSQNPGPVVSPVHQLVSPDLAASILSRVQGIGLSGRGRPPGSVGGKLRGIPGGRWILSGSSSPAEAIGKSKPRFSSRSAR